MRYTFLEDFAMQIYNELSICSIQDLDNIDIDYVSERLNIKTYYYDEKCEAIFYKGKYRIFLNEYLTPQQKWQNFAHELCHVLIHSGNQSILPETFRIRQEWQANNFAQHFCIPTFLLEQLVLPDYCSEAIELIAETFNVEFQFASMRLSKWIQKRESVFFFNKIKTLQTI